MQFGPQLSSDEVDLFTAHHGQRFASLSVFFFFFFFFWKVLLGFLPDILLMRRMMKYSFQVVQRVALSSVSVYSTETRGKTITPVQHCVKKKEKKSI